MKISLTPNDFKKEWFSGTGAGGQHRNRHQNCVRLIHIESGLYSTGQNHRSRNQNLKEAYSSLILKLADYYREKYFTTDYPKNTEVIRSYKLEDGLVIDHRTNEKTSIKNLDDFLEKIPSTY